MRGHAATYGIERKGARGACSMYTRRARRGAQRNSTAAAGGVRASLGTMSLKIMRNTHNGSAGVAVRLRAGGERPAREEPPM